MIETRRFILRRLTPDDVTDRYIGWLNDPDVSRFLDPRAERATIESIRTYVAERSARPDVVFYGIFTRHGEHIGNVKFESVDRNRGLAVMGMLIGERSWWGKGVATEVLIACCEALSTYGINRIVLGVDPANRGAVRAYRKAGFVEVPSHPAHRPPAGCLTMLRDARAARLAIGTAQFGLAYGVANRDGRVPHDEAAAILKAAQAAGAYTLDTAAAYGDAEAVLGELGVEGWRVITKLLPDFDGDGRRWVRAGVRRSLERLRVAALHGLLLHRAEHLSNAGGSDVYAAMRALKDEGVVAKIGVSVYSPDELDAVARYELDIVQAPFNVLDRRLATSGWLDRLTQGGTEVHARSVFLQGLLVMPPTARPRDLARHPALARWDDFLRRERAPALEAALGFVLAHGAISRVVVGVDNVRQFEAIIRACGAMAPGAPEELASDDVDLIEPRRWRAA